MYICFITNGLLGSYIVNLQLTKNTIFQKRKKYTNKMLIKLRIV